MTIPSKYRKVGIMTLGCKVNQYESCAIAELFEKNGFEIAKFSEKCGVYIINGCTVTTESDRKTRQMIRRAARHNPEALVLVTGCYSQLNPAKTGGIDGVDFVCGTSNKLRLLDAALGLISLGMKSGSADIKVEELEGVPFEKMTIHSSERTRAYIKIEDGCDNHCAYCTVPLARGNVRSKPIDDIISEAEGLVNNGYKEIVFTGIETASYGKDLEGQTLADLLERADKIEGIERIRLGSLDPSVMKRDFVDRVSKLEHICPSFHLSLQSGSSGVLARMRRKYNADIAESNILYMKEKISGVTFAADVIVGFPGETEEEFCETLEFVRRTGFIHLHIFTYSKRPMTEAFDMEEQIPEDVKNERFERLEAAQKEFMMEKAEEYIGQKKQVLFESCEDGIALGHTDDFLEVEVITPEQLHNEIRTVKLNGYNGTGFTGFIV